MRSMSVHVAERCRLTRAMPFIICGILSLIGKHDNSLKERGQRQRHYRKSTRCPIFQVITASWEAARGALVMMVLEMGPRGHLDAHIGVAS
jgi:hypothetical protein